MSDVVASGAVFVPAVMPTGVRFSEINETVGQEIASVLSQFTSQGVEVWLRFAHEVNYYVMPDTNSAANGSEYPGGSKQSPVRLERLSGHSDSYRQHKTSSFRHGRSFMTLLQSIPKSGCSGRPTWIPSMS